MSLASEIDEYHRIVSVVRKVLELKSDKKHGIVISSPPESGKFNVTIYSGYMCPWFSKSGENLVEIMEEIFSDYEKG